MANRRMFSLKIINSARFLKVPPEVQNLYFHLGLRADDDGIVEAFSVMRLIGSSEADLKLLHDKNFVHILNDDMVTYILDWQEHNKIRVDRKVDSIYQDLLIRIIPEVNVLEPKLRSDVKKNNIGLKHGQSMDVKRTDNGHKMGGIGKVRLGKVRLGKKSTPEKPKDFSSDREVPCQKIKEVFNSICSKLPQIKDIQGQRRKHVRVMWLAHPDLDYFINLFKMAAESNFLTGQNDRAWLADFDWIINQTNSIKILEGKYQNKVSLGCVAKSSGSSYKNSVPQHNNFDQRSYEDVDLETYYTQV